MFRLTVDNQYYQAVEIIGMGVEVPVSRDVINVAIALVGSIVVGSLKEIGPPGDHVQNSVYFLSCMATIDPASDIGRLFTQGPDNERKFLILQDAYQRWREAGGQASLFG